LRLHGGFTLLELLVVLLVIGTVITIALPRFQDMFEVRLKSSMRYMIGTIKFCFNESIIRQTPLRLFFDLENGTYWIAVLKVTGDTGEFVLLPSDLATPRHIPDGVRIIDVVTAHDIEKRTEGEGIFIEFYPNGFVEKAVIHLGDYYNRQYTLLTKPLTGGVEIFDDYIDFVSLVKNPLVSNEMPMGGTSGFETQQ